MAPLYRAEMSVMIRSSTLLALVGTRTICLRPLLITGLNSALLKSSTNQNITVRMPAFDVCDSVRNVVYEFPFISCLWRTVDSPKENSQDMRPHAFQSCWHNDFRKVLHRHGILNVDQNGSSFPVVSGLVGSRIPGDVNWMMRDNRR